MAGRTMDATIIACCRNLTNEMLGLKDHRTLAPAKARYARRQMRWEGKGLGSRERCCRALTMEIAAITGQNILVSKRVSYSGRLKIVYSNGEIIVTKIQTRIGMTANLSIIPLRFWTPKVARGASRDWTWPKFASDIRECMSWVILLILCVPRVIPHSQSCP